MGAVGDAVQLYMGCCGWDRCWTVTVSGWEKRQGWIQSKVSKRDKDETFHSFSFQDQL